MTIWPHDYYDPSLEPPEGSDPPEPILYAVTRETGDHHVGPMEYHVEVGAEEFYLCASCGPKDSDAVRMGPKEAADALKMGRADCCADCDDEF